MFYVTLTSRPCFTWPWQVDHVLRDLDLGNVCIWPYLPKWVAWILSAIFRFLQHSKWHYMLIKMMQQLSKLVHWFGNYDSVKSLTLTSVILRNRQIKFSSYSPFWWIACFKHLLMTTYKLVCVRRVFSDVEKTGETDFFEKPTSIVWHPL